MKILIMGHNGMLGNAVLKYFIEAKQSVETLPPRMRWPSNEMKHFLIDFEGSYIINCIGAIPQKKPTDQEYFELNSRLPLFLFGLSSKIIIHAATDCEFCGGISPEDFYQEDDYLDATDLYGISKAIPAEFIKNSNPENVKLIRSSIIGIEKNTNFSILNWFLSSADNGKIINGFNNHYWNGITTLEWAKMAYSIIKGEYEGNIFQLSSEKISKYELLKHFSKVFRPGYEIREAEHPKYQNKCLASNLKIRKIEIMLQELKDFYNLT